MNRKFNKYFAIAILLVAFDQFTKLWVKGFSLFGIQHKGLALGENLKIFGTIVQFTYVENAGMAFGITFGVFKIFLSLFSIFASIALIIYLRRLEKFDTFIKTGVMFILAGAVGNLIDRVFYGIIFDSAPIFYGMVVDFILVDIPDISIGSLHYTHWPVFNIADSCVSIGVVLLLIFNQRIPSFSEVFPKKTKLIQNEK